MFKPVLNTTTALAIACMTALTVATAWSEDANRLQFRNGRACWDTLCADESRLVAIAEERSRDEAKKADLVGLGSALQARDTGLTVGGERS